MGDALTAETIDVVLRAKLYQRFTQLHDAFRALDQNGNGMLSVDDFASAINGLGFARVTRGMTDALAAKYDANGDGLVSYAEFCSAISGKPIPGGPEPRALVGRAERVEETLRAHVLQSSTSLQNVRICAPRTRPFIARGSLIAV
jgi:hypothetical protein